MGFCSRPSAMVKSWSTRAVISSSRVSFAAAAVKPRSGCRSSSHPARVVTASEESYRSDDSRLDAVAATCLRLVANALQRLHHVVAAAAEEVVEANVLGVERVVHVPAPVGREVCLGRAGAAIRSRRLADRARIGAAATAPNIAAPSAGACRERRRRSRARSRRRRSASAAGSARAGRRRRRSGRRAAPRARRPRRSRACRRRWPRSARGRSRADASPASARRRARAGRRPRARSDCRSTSPARAGRSRRAASAAACSARRSCTSTPRACASSWTCGGTQCSTNQAKMSPTADWPAS